MTPERARELIPVLQAVAKVKEAEYFNKDNGEWCVAQNDYLSEHIDRGHSLRVKPEPKLIPFNYYDDLMGKTVIWTNPDFEYKMKRMIISQDRISVALSSRSNSRKDVEWVYYEDLLKHGTFPDGSPCGKEGE